MDEPLRYLSDYQLIELFDIYLTSAMDYFMYFVAVFFAFVVAAYVVGHRLSKPMLALLIAVYTIFSAGELLAVYVSTLWWNEIATELAHRGGDATGRMNYPISMFSGTAGQTLRYFTYLIYVASYIGGLYFLREVRALGKRVTSNKPLETDT